MQINWNNTSTLGSKTYRCGHCDHEIASNVGYFARSGKNIVARILICHACSKPTFFGVADIVQIPGASYGEPVQHLPEHVKSLYNEARHCMSVGSYTAAVMCCRKLLMNIAVAKGADAGKKFVEYIDYLVGHNLVPPGSEEWVAHVKDKGNEANHEVAIKSREEAEELLTFLSMLLKFIFEFPKAMALKTAQAKKNP